MAGWKSIKDKLKGHKDKKEKDIDASQTCIFTGHKI